MKNNSILTGVNLNRRTMLINSAKALAISPLLLSSQVLGKGFAGARSALMEVKARDYVNYRRNTSGWAHGGTKAMCAKFPPEIDPFVSGLGNACQLHDKTIIGPCYFDVTDERDDISEGQPGVPMVLAIKLVDINCQPIQGAKVETWWCNCEGVYSGDNSAASNGTKYYDDYAGDGGDYIPPFYPNTCSLQDNQALTSRFFRGTKTTCDLGNVYFKGCFPGWYTGRATHIHFRIALKENIQVVTQLGFDIDLANNIYINHPDYTGIEQDTTNETDFLFKELSSMKNHTLEVHRQYDGSMLAYRALQVNI